MKKSKPLASISLDLDDQWSYMKIHGDKGWENFPSYLDVFIPYILNVLEELQLKITFFVVGQDAAIEKNAFVLSKIVEKGHEVGNHSFHHESWLKQYTRQQIDDEIISAENAIMKATGVKPEGFRGPGFSWSNHVLESLRSHGYAFDASTLPTFLGPIARFYYFRRANLSKEERKGRKELFGSFRDGLRPVNQYEWRFADGSTLLEIPVTTIPIFKVPFHLSYLLFLSRYSKMLMKAYLRFSILMCKITRTSPSILLHPLDLISGDQIPELAFFPGMDIQSETKIKLFKYVMKVLGKHFKLVPMNAHARQVRSNRLKQIDIDVNS